MCVHVQILTVVVVEMHIASSRVFTELRTRQLDAAHGARAREEQGCRGKHGQRGDLRSGPVIVSSFSKHNSVADEAEKLKKNRIMKPAQLS